MALSIYVWHQHELQHIISSHYDKQDERYHRGTFEIHLDNEKNQLTAVIQWGFPTQNPPFSISTSPTDFI